MKFTCVIDTNSYIYLNKCSVFREKTALELLHNNVNIIFSPAVEDEIVDYFEPPMPTAQQRRAHIKRTSYLRLQDYELRLFGNNLAKRAKDKGERDNFSVLIDLYLGGKKTGTIFLSDDDEALKRVLVDKLGCFPIFHRWSSHDVIIFLYLVKAIPKKEFAEDAIRDLDNIIVPNSTKNREVTTARKQERIAKYLGYINQISGILN
jgi:hypothetical protein